MVLEAGNETGRDPKTYPVKYQLSGPDFPTEYPIQKLIKHLPKHDYLPRLPLKLSKEEELYLRRAVATEMKGFDRKWLKDLYMDLTGHDKRLTGFVEYHDLFLLLAKYQVSRLRLFCRVEELALPTCANPAFGQGTEY